MYTPAGEVLRLRQGDRVLIPNSLVKRRTPPPKAYIERNRKIVPVGLSTPVAAPRRLSPRKKRAAKPRPLAEPGANPAAELPSLSEPPLPDFSGELESEFLDQMVIGNVKESLEDGGKL